MIYFTSDLHLGHRAIIRMTGRPFLDVTEMNETLIKRYNDRVHADDTVYLLGDLSFRIPVEEANALIARLNGNKIFIAGNHDAQYRRDLFSDVGDYKAVGLDGFYWVMMHYPLADWNRKFHGAIDLHGHCHGHKEDNEKNRHDGLLRYDVGVDANDFAPVSIVEIEKFFFLRNGIPHSGD